MRRYAALLILMATMASAQARKNRPTVPPKTLPPPAVTEIKEYPIATFQVEGNLVYPSKAIIDVAGLKPADPANKDRFEAAREHLLATGAFDSVGYRYFTASDGVSYEAVWQIAEANPLYPFKVEDLPVTQQEVEADLKARDLLYVGKLPPIKSRLELYARWIQQLAAKKGFSGSVVSKVDADGPDKLFILFRPAGSLPAVADVKFTGSDVIPQSQLRTTMNGVAVGTVYNETRFRLLLDTSVRPLYEARGRLKVAFPKITTIPAADVNGLVVTVAVEEGPVYQLGDVTMRGPGSTVSGLARAADFKIGEIADMKTINEGIENIRLTLRRQGYMNATAAPERQLDDAKKVLNLKVDIVPGKQYVFRRLNIEGLDIESEPVIRKMWGLQEGKPFNPEYPDRFLNRVREEGIFDNLGDTRADQRADEAAGAVDVTLVFGTAAKPKSILKSDPKN